MRKRIWRKSKQNNKQPFHLRLTCSLCSVSLFFFSPSVSKTKIVLMEQFKHIGRLLFRGSVFHFADMHRSARSTQQYGGLVWSARTCGLICYSLLDRCKTEGKCIDFFANMVACWSWGHINFHPSESGRKRRESVTLVLPVSTTTRIIRVRAGHAADDSQI